MKKVRPHPHTDSASAERNVDVGVPPVGHGVQGRDRIAAHLVFVAAEVASVALTTEGRTLRGTLAMPNHGRLVPFVPHRDYGDGLELPLRGMPASLAYTAHEVSYGFGTTMAGVDETGRWLMQPPETIDATDRRLLHRHPVLGDPAFSLELNGSWQPPGFRPFSALDISADGLGVLFDPHRTPMAPHDLVSARLLLPTAFTFMHLLLRVANVRPVSRHAWLRAAGTRFVDLRMEHRRALALSISAWEQGRRVV